MIIAFISTGSFLNRVKCSEGEDVLFKVHKITLN